MVRSGSLILQALKINVLPHPIVIPNSLIYRFNQSIELINLSIYLDLMSSFILFVAVLVCRLKYVCSAVIYIGP